MKVWKKILILGMALLIIAGIIVVALRGFNVSLMFGKHENIELKLDKDVYLEDIDAICKEVFSNKKYVVKEVELFNDSFQVNVESITDEEKENLINKVNEKYETEKTVDDLTIYSVSNVRIRDVVKPYIIPTAIVYVLIYVYILIKFKKIDSKKIVLTDFVRTILIEAMILSLIAITRLPVNEVYFYGILVVAIGNLVYTLSKSERELSHEVK